jgi:hypothetical protein
MSYLVPLLLLCAATPLVYMVVRIGGLDPHHVAATPGWLGSGLRTLFVVVSALLFIGLEDKSSSLGHFFAAFVLANVVAIAYTSPDRYRKDEYPNAFERFVEGKKGPLAGGILLGGLSALAYWLSPNYWFHAIAILGTVLIFSKGKAALLVIQADEGEFRHAEPLVREQLAHYWGPRVFLATAAYALLCSTVGIELVHAANFAGSGWFGWVGIAGGSILSVLLSHH